MNSVAYRQPIELDAIIIIIIMCPVIYLALRTFVA